MAPSFRSTIIVHGGAWAIPQDQTSATKAGVIRAAKAAYKILKSSGSAISAVETAVRVLESDTVFDAGVGSCLNEAGEVEMDAIIMSDGPISGIQLGAVAALSCTKNPVSVARAVAERTPHCLLVGEGANAFAKTILPEEEVVMNTQELVTKAGREEWERFSQFPGVVKELFNASEGMGHDTVGAVAIDAMGSVACATSTGGITCKKVGRVGDSPIVGSGLFCQKDVGGCSSTGHGESIMKVTLARTAMALMEFKNMHVQQAVDEALQRMWEQTHGCGGLIMMNMTGDLGWGFTTERMAWATVDKDGCCWVGIDKGEKVQVNMDEDDG